MENLDAFKGRLIQYHDSEKYEKEISAVIKQAKTYLKTRLAQKSPKKLAMVLDIDETSLSNYNDMFDMQFGGKLKDIIAEEGNGTDTVIKPTLELYQYAKAHKVAVFFVTGRSEIYRTATIKNLKLANYKNWDDLILKPKKYEHKPAAIYKIAARKAITNKGYDIVINIGDQMSDLSGGYSDKIFKLPNPYYFIS